MKNFRYYIPFAILATIACSYSTPVKAAANPIREGVSRNSVQALNTICELVHTISLNDAKLLYIKMTKESLLKNALPQIEYIIKSISLQTMDEMEITRSLSKMAGTLYSSLGDEFITYQVTFAILLKNGYGEKIMNAAVCATKGLSKYATQDIFSSSEGGSPAPQKILKEFVDDYSEKLLLALYQ